MIPVTDGLLGEMVQAIVDEVDPDQVILFGSRARGDEREHSVEPFASMVDSTPYAVEFRHAGVGPDGQPIDREGALAHVESLLERVRRELALAEGA